MTTNSEPKTMSAYLDWEGTQALAEELGHVLDPLGGHCTTTRGKWTDEYRAQLHALRDAMRDLAPVGYSLMDLDGDEPSRDGFQRYFTALMLAANLGEKFFALWKPSTDYTGRRVRAVVTDDAQEVRWHREEHQGGVWVPVTRYRYDTILTAEEIRGWATDQMQWLTETLPKTKRRN